MASHTKHHLKQKHHRKGGRVVYAGADSNVAHEAEEEKRGGRVHHVGGHKSKHRIHKKHGGGIGSDKSPFSSAAHGGMHSHPAHHGHGHAHGGAAFKGAHRGR